MNLLNKVYSKIKQKIEKKLKIYFLRQYFIKYFKSEGSNSFTVISAVYNVDKYLEEYFQSITNQTLIFEKHIHLIMVDDGSTDNSANIIKKWQTKYPNNITYIKKENGGQASARNFAIEYIKTPWVTFIDPDDFLDVRYFENVDKFLSLNKSNNIGLVCCKWVFYMEKDKGFLDTHPLTFRFKNGDRVINHSKDKKFISPSVATAFYKSDVIHDNNLTFDEYIKPNFEDAYFSGRYQLHIQELNAAYLASSIYYYRKREDGSSTLDNSWSVPSRFKEVLQRGHLELLREANKNNKQIPTSIQRLVLYDIFWYFKKIINNSSSVSFLNTQEIDTFKKLLKNIFNYIDIDTIDAFELAGCQYYHKVGLINLYKDRELPYQVVYIDNYNSDKNEMKIRYYSNRKNVKINLNEMETITKKVRKYDFLDNIFIYETIIWIKLNSNKKHMELLVNDTKTYIELDGKRYEDKIAISDVIKAYKLHIVSAFINYINTYLLTLNTPDKKGLQNSWLILDRDNLADDNAEHFYRYVKTNYPNENIFFILRKSSHDWSRLKNDGFNLIPFGSITYLFALIQANHLISSHADSYVTDFIPRRFFKSMLKYKFTFLQHGITRDDISNWLNNKDIDCFITSTPQEYQAIIGDNSHYKFTSKEVALTGLARHDRLITREEPTQKVILIMPTWRKSFVGDTKKNSAKRTKTDAFYNSNYAKYWRSILHSSELKKLAQENGYKVVFFPHANMQIYIDWFDTPSWIEVRTHETDPILQKLFRRANIMITDYSSVFFEFAFLQKALIYYQFDYDFMYGGEQQSQLGYFDFKKDGFGAVVKSEKELLSEIEHLLLRDGEPDSIYKKRMIDTFPNRDGKNCQRIYEAIKNLG